MPLYYAPEVSLLTPSEVCAPTVRTENTFATANTPCQTEMGFDVQGMGVSFG